jgi:hypothetical protein
MRTAIRAAAGLAAITFLLTGCGGADQSSAEGAMESWLEAASDSDFESACLVSLDEDRAPFREGTEPFKECVAGLGTMTDKYGAHRFHQMLEQEPAQEGDGDRVDFSWNANAGNEVALDEIRVRKIGDQWYVENAR